MKRETDILKSISKSIKRNVRITDVFGRWGGEEFIGVFEIKNNYEATLLAEKMRILISGTEIYHSGKSLSVTASFGVTAARDDDSIYSIIKRADLLMYHSKKKNKNCVTSDV